MLSLSRIYKFKNEKETINKAAVRLNQLLEENQRPKLLMLSGGSALKLVDKIRSIYLNENLTITVLDERFSSDPKINNFSQIKQTKFFQRAIAKGCHFIDTSLKKNFLPAPAADRKSKGQLAIFAQKFEDNLKKWRYSYPQGRIIATQGIGADGHTAGILPVSAKKSFFQKLFIDTKKWVVGYLAETNNPYPARVTVTFPFLKKEIAASVVFVVGRQKKGALTKILAPQGDLRATPGRIIRAMKNVYLYTDINLSSLSRSHKILKSRL